MKRLLVTVLALTIAGTSAASAHGFGRGPFGPVGPGFGGYGPPYRHNGGNAVAAIGLGILALGVIGAIASQNRTYARPYYPAPAAPPPSPYGGYGYGYGYGYGAPAPAPYGYGGYGAPYGGGYGYGPYYYGR